MDESGSNQSQTHNIEQAEAFDAMYHAWLSKFIGWVSPAAFISIIFDWLTHLNFSPAKQISLLQKAQDNYVKIVFQSVHYFHQAKTQGKIDFVKHHLSDPRFKDQAWEKFPFNLYAQAFLLYEQWWDEATTNVRGVSVHNQQVINFMVGQLLDLLSPSNSPIFNPQVLEVTMQTNGKNFIDGFNNLVEDSYRIANKLPPVGSENFKVGEDVAITPGVVIYRNDLMELIQYKPTTAQVYSRPMLMIPAWIMKYYILDLSPHNSLVKYLVDHGHTVFMISWKNPKGEESNTALEDYIHDGIVKALDVINVIIPHKKINATGYCLGGTLLMMTAAYLASLEDDRLGSITLFAAQTDFKEPGELSLFIDQSQISYLEDVMWEKGYLDGHQMSWAFSMLRSNDLIWSRIINDYLLGKRRPLNDLMAWDNDTTRLPFRMHSEYLRKLFLDNSLVGGRFQVDKKRIVLKDIKNPIFCVATLKDHVSPWRSVYRIHLFTNTDITFVLTNKGHNSGIVNEPGHPHRSYQIDKHKKGSKHRSSDNWLKMAPQHEGSWWPAWLKWLKSVSGKKVTPPHFGAPNKGYTILCPAPGTYVLKK